MFRIIVLVATVLQVVISVPVIAGEPIVERVGGITTAAKQAWLAGRYPAHADSAVVGIAWYNNDANVIFPKLHVWTEDSLYPTRPLESNLILERFSGGTSSWSEVSITSPIEPNGAWVYVVIEFPSDIKFNDIGLDGGPGVGIYPSRIGEAGWISGDGETWMSQSGEYCYAIRPLFAYFEGGEQTKRLGEEEMRQVEMPMAPYLTALPNPFNPITELRFGLTRASDVVVDVYNLRGAKIARLLRAALPAGHHTVSWTGVDDMGHRAASGPYFVQIRAGDVTLNQRVMLVK